MPRHVVLPISAILISVVAAITSAAWGTAATIAASAKWQFEQAVYNGRPISAQQWSVWKTTFGYAQALSPIDGRYDDDIGRLYEWRAEQKRAWLQDARDDRQKAQRYFLASVRQRPAWPLGWARLAESQAYKPDLDNVFFGSLDKAAVLGSWEPEVQDILLRIGLMRWDKLSPDAQETVRTIIERALGDYPRDRYTIKLAVNYGRQDVVRPLLMYPEQRQWLHEWTVAKQKGK